MTNNQLIEKYKTFELNSIYTVKQTEEFNAIFMKDNPISIQERNNMNIYNKIFDFIPKETSIQIKKDKIEINFIIKSAKNNSTEKNKSYDLNEFNIDFKEFCVNIGYNYYNFKETSNGTYYVEIPYTNINISGKSSGIFLTFEDKHGFKFKKDLSLKKDSIQVEIMTYILVN